MFLKVGARAVIAAVFIVGAATARPVNAAPPGDACALLTQAQVSTALSVSVGAAAYLTPTFKKTCMWTTKGAGWVTLELVHAEAFQAGKQMGAMQNIIVTPIGGVGDDAFYLAVGNNVGLIVKKGDVAFKVAVYARVPIERKEAVEKTLAQQVVAEL